MKVDSDTFFYLAGSDCQVAFGYEQDGDTLRVNPPIILVDNWAQGDVIEVNNNHEYDLHILLNRGENEIGVWHVTYKGSDLINIKNQ